MASPAKPPALLPQEPPSKKSMDNMFGETIARIMGEIPEVFEKDMMRLEVQKMIY